MDRSQTKKAFEKGKKLSLRGAAGDEAISQKAKKQGQRLLRGVYPELVEGLAMTREKTSQILSKIQPKENEYAI